MLKLISFFSSVLFVSFVLLGCNTSIASIDKQMDEVASADRNMTIVNLIVRMDNKHPDTYKNKYAQGGDRKVLLGSFFMRAQNESVSVEKLTVLFESLNNKVNPFPYEMFEQLYLVGPDKKTVLESAPVASKEAFFNGLNILVSKSRKNYYVMADLTKIGKYEGGILDNGVKIAIKKVIAIEPKSQEYLSDGLTGEGPETGKVTYGGKKWKKYLTRFSKKTKILASQIVNVELLDNYEGFNIETSISGTGWHKVMMIEFNIGSSPNTLITGEGVKFLLNKVKVKIEKSKTLQIANLRIERVGPGTSGNSINASELAFSIYEMEVYAVFNMSNPLIAHDDELIPGQKAVFMVEVEISGNPSNKIDWLKANLDNLDGKNKIKADSESANFKWKDSQEAKKFKRKLWLNKSKIDGEKIQDPA